MDQNEATVPVARSRPARNPALLCLLRPLLHTALDETSALPAPAGGRATSALRPELRSRARTAA